MRLIHLVATRSQEAHSHAGLKSNVPSMVVSFVHELLPEPIHPIQSPNSHLLNRCALISAEMTLLTLCRISAIFKVDCSWRKYNAFFLS
jgi:hypothetical protein